MKLKHVLEVKVRPGDPAMDNVDFHTDKNWRERYGDLPKREGPYAVGWSAQSLEWYGDEEPAKKRGRYKPKGDGGEITAINVPSYSTAKQLADKLDRDFDNGQFYDKGVYAKYGKDWYVLQYDSAYVKPMSEVEEWDSISRNVKDFSKQ